MIQPNLPVVVVYKLSARDNAKKQMKVFKGTHIDKVNNERTNHIPRGVEILEMGMGAVFIKKWKKKHKIYSITK